MDVLDHLIEEHRAVEHLLDDLSDALSAAGGGTGGAPEPDERQELTGQLDVILRMHLAVEQRFVSPLVVPDTPDDLERRDALFSHDAREALATLRAAVAAGGATVDDPDVEWAVGVVRAGLHDHVIETEEHLFPRLRAAAAARFPELSHQEVLHSELRQEADRQKADLDNVVAEELYLAARRREPPPSASPS